MSRGGDDDEGLLLAAGRGDAAAWARFRDRHLPVVGGYLLRRTGDATVAAELTAEAFAAALLATPDYLPGATTPRAWVVAIADRTLRTSRRTGRIVRGARQRLALERVDSAEAALPADGDPLVLDAGAAIRHVVGELRRCQREVVVARIVEERGWDEIEAELDGDRDARACARCGLAALRGRLLAARG
jgi:RNA polymerase sigma-70 factor (ECF subfamily)